MSIITATIVCEFNLLNLVISLMTDNRLRQSISIEAREPIETV